MNALPDGEVGCVTMACGTGKTLVVKTFVFEHGPGLTIIVFPRLALIEQYTRCYTNAADRGVIKYITVGSIGYSATANRNTIRRLVNLGHENQEHVVILTTYISIVPLATTLEGYEVDQIIYDESHHTNTELQDDAFSILDPKRSFYFTATPVSNHLNIIYKYSYEQALADEISREFIVQVYVTAQPKSPEAIYEMLGYFRNKFDIRNTICYHKYSNIPGDDEEGSSVYDHLGFVGVDTATIEEGDDEPQLLLPAGSEIFCFQGRTPIEERVRILEHIKSPDRYSVLHSCETVAEGVDTQEIDSVCIIDEIKDVVRMTQILGRAMRKSRVHPDKPSYVIIPFFNCEGRGHQGQNLEKLSVHTDTSLKGRSKKAKGPGSAAEPDVGYPRHIYTPNQIDEIDLDKVDGNESIVLISGIMSFLARDKGERGGLVDFELEEVHKRVDNFKIEATQNDGTTTTTIGVAGRDAPRAPREAPPQIELYGTNKPARPGVTPLEMMVQLATEAVEAHRENLAMVRAPFQKPETNTAGYYFVDFVASVIRTGDPRYKRHPDVEDILADGFGENWEYGLYTPQRLDERIVDIINNKRFGYPKLLPDAFTFKWRTTRTALGTDVAFVSTWKSR